MYLFKKKKRLKLGEIDNMCKINQIQNIRYNG